jgi:hypothetical protein
MTPQDHYISHQQKTNIDSLKQKSWTGGVSAQTQFLFNKIIRENQKIHEKLILLQDVGITNDSNSLFQQILEDIQAIDKGFTKNEIINCIKASSFGKASALEPNKSDPSNKIWLGVKRNQLV